MHTELITLLILLVAVVWETGIDVIKMQSENCEKKNSFDYFEILQHAFSSCFLINEIRCTLNNRWYTLCCSLQRDGSVIFGLLAEKYLLHLRQIWVGIGAF